MTDSAQVAWRAIRYDSPVLAADGSRVGTVREVLGSDAEDVFHGLRLGRPGGEPDVVVAADDISGIYEDRIETSLEPADVAALPHYDEAAEYHVGVVGRVRHHLGWKSDSKSDEEAG